jgi:hypothetical protein
MTAQIVPLLRADRSIKEIIDAIHEQFGLADAAGKRADRARINAGMMLNDLRKRVEAGEVGENIDWWEWYDDRFVRSRKDARKVMNLASAEDPDAALAAEQEANREAKARERQKGADVSASSENKELVTHALRLVEEMDANQRRRFFAALRSRYAYSQEDD